MFVWCNFWSNGVRHPLKCLSACKLSRKCVDSLSFVCHKMEIASQYNTGFCVTVLTLQYFGTWEILPISVYTLQCTISLLCGTGIEYHFEHEYWHLAFILWTSFMKISILKWNNLSSTLRFSRSHYELFGVRRTPSFYIVWVSSFHLE